MHLGGELNVIKTFIICVSDFSAMEAKWKGHKQTSWEIELFRKKLSRQDGPLNIIW